MKTWLHRISYHAEASYPLLHNGILTIGFSDFADIDFLNQTQAGDGQFFDRSFQENWGSVPRTRNNLWHFIRSMEIGDRVVVPTAGAFSVFEITGPADLIRSCGADGIAVWGNGTLTLKPDGAWIADRHLDLGFFRQVKCIMRDVSRYDYLDAPLTSRLKIRLTTADISDLGQNLDRALVMARDASPLNLHSLISEAACREMLRLIRSEITPSKFELLLKWYFERMGAKIIPTPANARDKQGDADIAAEFEALRTIYYIQAKHYQGDTSVWAAQQVVEYKTDRETRDNGDGYTRVAWVVSTSDSFSTECQEVAQRHSVRLINGIEFAQMLLNIGLDGLDKAL
jgi:hypothetical protein